jgi:hypothetical protein
MNQVKVKVTLRLTVSQSVSFGVEPHLFYNSGRTEEKPPPPTFRVLLCYSMFIRCYETRVNLAATVRLSRVYNT